jgi:hypothetical protein
MIENQFGSFILVCDICGEEPEEYWDNFQDAVDGKKELGWISQKTSKGWHDICPECQKEV